MRPLLIGFFVCINIHLGYAQWTEQDSIWLKDVLAGKDSIKLDPEFQKAIQSGSFLNPEPGKPMGKPQLAAPSNIPITKDFSEYIQQDDTTHRKVALKDLPPSVFWRHNPPYKKILPVYQSILDELKRTPSCGRTSLATFDLGRMTSRKTYVHKRNAKRNGTWQNYGNLPTPDVISKKRNSKDNRQRPQKGLLIDDPTTNRLAYGPSSTYGGSPVDYLWYRRHQSLVPHPAT